MKNTHKKVKGPALAGRKLEGARSGARFSSSFSLAAGVALLTLVVYLPSLFNGFVNWDDDVYIYANLHIQSLDWGFFKWAFTDLSLGFWHPLTWISYALDHLLWGVNPFGHHLSAMLLHVGSTFLVVRLTIALLEYGKGLGAEKRGVLIAAGVTGLLFGLHPLHVESVAWASERKDLLCAFFTLLSLFAYLRPPPLPAGTEVKSCFTSRNYLLALTYFLLALASKTMAVSLPLLLLILDWYPLGRMRSIKEAWARLLEKVPFVAASLAIAIVSLMAQKSTGALVLMATKPLAVRIPVAFRGLIMYLWKMVAPFHLIPVYPYPENVSFLSPAYLAFTALALAITAAVAWRAQKERVWLAAWAYYVISLLPVLGLVQVGIFSMADRFTYLPSIGPFLLVGLGAAGLWRRVGIRLVGKACLAGLAFILVASLSYLTIKQIGIWKSGLDLWTYSIRLEPRDYPFAYINLGSALVAEEKYGEAIEGFDAALAIDPTLIDAYLNRGLAYYKMGRVERALVDYNAALALKPAPGQASNSKLNRGAVFLDRGLAHYKLGRMEQALEDYERALALDPGPDVAGMVYSNRGAIFFERKELARALDDFNRAVTINHGSIEGFRNRGVVLEEMGQLERAAEDYSSVLALKPWMADVYVDRGKLYRRMGRNELARDDFQKACALGNQNGCSQARL